MIQAEQQQLKQPAPANIGDAFIQTFIVLGLLVMKGLWWVLLRPILWAPLAFLGGIVYVIGPIPTTALAIVQGLVLHGWYCLFPESYERRMGYPMRCLVIRIFRYELGWRGRMRDAEMLKIVKLMPDRCPKIVGVETNRWRDRVRVKLVRGQEMNQIYKKAGKLASCWEVDEVRIKRVSSREADVIFIKADPLSQIIPAFPIEEEVDLENVKVGLTDEGDVWTVPVAHHKKNCHGLFVATSGGGKSTALWSLLRGVAPMIRDGLVQVWVADPKEGVEFNRGKPLFYRYADESAKIMAMMKDLKGEMEARGRRQRDKDRMHEATVEEPHILFLLDEALSVTAFETTAKRAAYLMILGQILTKGRALGITAMLCSQDATKAALVVRDFVGQRWCGRVLHPQQVDMVLGDYARERGAKCDLEEVVSKNTPGVGYVESDDGPEPVRVRSSLVTNDDIRDMCENYAPERSCMTMTSTPKRADTRELLAISTNVVSPPDLDAEVEAMQAYWEKLVMGEDVEEEEEIDEEVVEDVPSDA